MDNPQTGSLEDTITDAMKDPIGYAQAVQLSIQYRDCVQLRKLVLNKDSLLPGVFWDIALAICNSFATALYNESPMFYETCEEGLNYLIQNGNPKEILLIVLEHIENSADDLQYRTLSEATQKVLLMLPNRRVTSLDSAVETMVKYLSKLDLPNEQKLEGEEKKLLEGDANVVRIGEVVRIFLRSVAPFVKEVSVNNPNNIRSTNEHQIQTLTKYLLKVLCRPLLYVDLSHMDDTGAVTKTLCRENAEILMSYLSDLQVDFHKLIVSVINNNAEIKRKVEEQKERKRIELEDNYEDGCDVEMYEDLDEPVSELALAGLLYLIHGEQLQEKCWPSVYSHTYLLIHSLHFIQQLLQKKESLVVYKGIFLAESLLDKVPRKSLESDLVEIDSVKNFVLVLTDIMLQCSVTELRQLALKLLPFYINKFDLDGRYRLMMFVLHKVSHSGVSGLIINIIKDQLAAILKSSNPDCAPFVGPPLEKLLHVAFQLPDGATSDLLDQSDRIMSGLNLVRFLLLTDTPERNFTGIWNRINVLETKFLTPLKTGIDMSRAHYDMELKNMQETKDPSSIEMSVNVAGVNSPGMSKQQKMEILRNASLQFDLMDSVHARVCEIISTQQHPNKS